MTDTELEQSEELQKEYWTLMFKVLNMQQKITKIYAHLSSASDGCDHNKCKVSLARAKQEASQLDKEFPDGIEYAISSHEKQIDELNEEVATEKISDQDFAILNKEFADCR